MTSTAALCLQHKLQQHLLKAPHCLGVLANYGLDTRAQLDRLLEPEHSVKSTKHPPNTVQTLQAYL